MHTDQPKFHVLQRFLEFVRGYVPLSDVRIATLGGQGWEAQLWTEHGIAPSHAWLVERDSARRAYLLRRFGFQHTIELRNFPRVLRTMCGRDGTLDAFHLDLCGTFESSIEEFRPLVPRLVVSPGGRCLAVTVAEERRNRTLEEFPVLRVRGEHLLGREGADGFFRRLCAEQERIPRPRVVSRILVPADPEKGAKREFGFFVHLFSLLVTEGQRMIAVPEVIERYVYVSRYRQYPWRMRTYLFHLGAASELNATDAARELTARWQQSPLSVFQDGAFVRLDHLPRRRARPREEREERKEKCMSVTVDERQFEKLRTLATAASQEHAEQFNALLALAHLGARARPAIERAQAALSEVLGAGGGTAPTVAPPAEGERTAPVPNGETLQVQLDLLRAEVQGEKQLARAIAEAHNRLGLKGRKHVKNRGRRVGALRSRTHGRHRPNFVQRVVAAFGEGLLAELAALYSVMEGPTTEQNLRSEAGL